MALSALYAINAKVLVSDRMPIIYISLEPDSSCAHAAIVRIVLERDAEGAVIMLSKDNGIGENEVLLTKTVSLFLVDRLAV